MYCFRCNRKDISGKNIILDDKKVLHHIKDVLRLKADSKLLVFDDAGNEYKCVVAEISADKIRLEVKNTVRPAAARIKLAVACAIPKKAKMDEIIDKLTQLGVDRIIPLETERVIVKLDRNKKIDRQRRWQRIAESASKQCHRNIVPVIEPVKNMKEVLEEAADYDLKLMPHLEERARSLKEACLRARARNILVFIGPEGDFSPQEVRMAEKSGCFPITLGKNVLRVDTAAIAVASFIMLYCPFDK